VPAGRSSQPGAVRGAPNYRREIAVLPAAHRLVSSADFADVIAHGVRVGRPTLVVHARAREQGDTQVGFVVSKAVGNAVVRNRVKRRLRAMVRPYALGASPNQYKVVVRALPAAADQPGRVAGDLDSAWQQAMTKAGAAS